MKDLNAIYKQCVKEVKDAGIKTGTISRVYVNNRAVKRWGLCTRDSVTNTYQIQVSSILLNDKNPDSALKDTLIHEMIHTCSGCMNHGEKWQSYADIMNRKYGYNIKRVSSSQEKMVDPDTLPKPKYEIVCQKCGHVWGRNRMCKVIENIECYHCSCGGKLKLK